LTIKADFAGAVDKGQRLKKHISVRTMAKRPWCVTLQIAFYDTSLLSAVPGSDCLVSIALHGYVQTKNGTWVSTMQNWIEPAVWTPVPCPMGLLKSISRQTLSQQSLLGHSHDQAAGFQ
jgi:hypothetical protein